MLTRRKNDPVDKIIRLAGGRFESRKKFFRVPQVQVRQPHIGLHGNPFNLEAQDVSQRTIGVGEAEEKIPMLVIGGAADNVAVAQ